MRFFRLKAAQLDACHRDVIIARKRPFEVDNATAHEFQVHFSGSPQVPQKPKTSEFPQAFTFHAATDARYPLQAIEQRKMYAWRGATCNLRDHRRLKTLFLSH